jgi:hypothetical protein
MTFLPVASFLLFKESKEIESQEWNQPTKLFHYYVVDTFLAKSTSTTGIMKAFELLHRRLLLEKIKTSVTDSLVVKVQNCGRQFFRPPMNSGCFYCKSVSVITPF